MEQTDFGNYELVHVQDTGCICTGCNANAPVSQDGDTNDDGRLTFGSVLRGDFLEFLKESGVNPLDWTTEDGTNPGTMLRDMLADWRDKQDTGLETNEGATATGDGDPEYAEQQASASPNSYDTDTTDADQGVDGLIGSSRWNTTDLTFGFATSSTDYESTYYDGTAASTATALTAQAQDVARSSFAEYAAISGLTFIEYTNAGPSGQQVIDADLRLAQSDRPGTAYAYYPSTNSVGGDSFYGTGNYNTPVIGNYQYHTILHEIGHALGLKHGHETSGPGAVPYEMDSMEFTVMTYRSFVGKDLSYGYANESWGFAQSLMLLDIAAIQRMYGANFETEATDTVYTFDTGTGEMFVNGAGIGTPGGNRVFRTVWDGNGVDTYDFSNYTTDMAIDLSPGGYSDFDVNGNFQRAMLDFGYAGNVVYSRGHLFNAMQFEGDARSLIENATGGSGNDAMIGNAADNVLDGGAGNDTLTDTEGNDTYIGGDGTDEVIFAGTYADYGFSLSGAFLQAVDVATDWIENTVEWLTFSNGTYSFQQVVDNLDPGTNTAPVAANDSTNALEDQIIAIDVLANDTDADGTALSVSAIGGQSISVGQTITLLSGARVTLNADGTLTYDQNGAFDSLNTGETAQDTFTYTVTDGLATDTATVTIVIDGVFDNSAPTAVDDNNRGDESAILSGNVLTNDSDVDGHALTVTAVNGATLGAQVTLSSGALLTMGSDGAYTYDTNGAFDSLEDGQTATDSFTYTVSDGNGGTAQATVTITIDGISPPSLETSFVIDFENVATGDYLGENGLMATGITTVANTSLAGSQLGYVQSGVDAELSFSAGTIDLNAILLASAGGRVRINISALDENGVVVGSQNVNVRFGRDVSRELDATFDNAAKIVISGNGDFFIDGLSVVTRAVGDETGNIAPIAANDGFSVAEAALLVGNLLTDNGFGSDSDPDGDSLTVTSVNGENGGTTTLASGATVTFDSDGSFTYDQSGAFDALYDGQTGTDSFTYTVSDGRGGTDTATVTVDVSGAGDPPPGPTTTTIDFETDPTVDGFVFNDISVIAFEGDNAGISGGDTLVISRTDGADFSFDAAVLRAVTGKNNTASIEGFQDGVLVVTEDLRVRDNRDVAPSLADTNFDVIDRVEITVSGGVIVDDLIFIS